MIALVPSAEWWPGAFSLGAVVNYIRIPLSSKGEWAEYFYYERVTLQY